MHIIVTGPHATGPKAPIISPPELAWKPKIIWLSTTSVAVRLYPTQIDNQEQLVEHYITWEVEDA